MGCAQSSAMRFLLSATCLTSSMGFAGSALAQGAAASVTVEEIVVTGSRIVRDGFQAPTPVTIAPVEDLQAAAPESLSAALIQLPQLQGSRSTSNANFSSNPNVVAAPRGNYLDLRNVGSIRTLNLLNGMRVPKNTYLGDVDTNIIPQMLISRVDVVTGGASAAYGSDAVSGVVNFVLDTEFTGVKALVQGGVSELGDHYNYRVAAAGGFRLGERGHLLISAERSEIDGLLESDRDYIRENTYTSALGKFVGVGGVGTLAHPRVYYPNTNFSGMSAGGHVISAGPLLNLYFPTSSTFRPINLGTPTGSPGINVGSELIQFSPDNSLTPKLTEQSGFVRASYDSENVSTFVQGLVSAPSSRSNAIELFLQNLPIFSGNANLPPGFQALMDQNGIQQFSIGRAITEIPGPDATDKNLTYNIMAGASGRLMDRFSWDVSYSYGSNRLRFSTERNEFRLVAAAVDVVRDPATGAKVCRVTLTNPGLYPGCVPMNVFGVGSISPEALDYIVNPTTYSSWNKSHGFAATMRGDVLSLPAGPVSTAFGAEYRRESLHLISNADPAVVRPVTGLRGIAVTQDRFYQTNIGVADGSINVKEVFGEAVVPVVSGMALARSIELNGAVRYTDYSVSGGVVTWKVGSTWQINDDIRLRATQSRDIRAPNTFEVFAGQTSTAGNTFDPHTGVTKVYTAISGGNPGLEPEKAKTLTIGTVLAPGFIPGFTMSVDYYDISIKGSITSRNVTQILDICEQSGGRSPICASIERPFPFSNTSAENFPTVIRTGSVNAAEYDQRGIDFEAAYTTKEVGPGDLTLRLLGTYVDSITQRASVLDVTQEQTGYANFPNLRATLSARYEIPNWSFFVQQRLIGKAKIGGPTTFIDEANLAEVWYTDATITAQPSFAESYNGEVFLTIRNLFDRDATLTPSTLGGGAVSIVNGGRYDVVGRNFTLGVRMRM